jgi:hypothetical protein
MSQTACRVLQGVLRLSRAFPAAPANSLQHVCDMTSPDSEARPAAGRRFDLAGDRYEGSASPAEHLEPIGTPERVADFLPAGRLRFGVLAERGQVRIGGFRARRRREPCDERAQQGVLGGGDVALLYPGAAAGAFVGQQEDLSRPRPRPAAQLRLADGHPSDHAIGRCRDRLLAADRPIGRRARHIAHRGHQI